MSPTETIPREQSLFPEAKTADLGVYKKRQELIDALLEKKVEIIGTVRNILENILLSKQEKRVKLVTLTGREIGRLAGRTFLRYVSYKQVADAVEDIGGIPCITESIPQVCLQGKKGDKGFWGIVIMKPIRNRVFIFGVNIGGKTWLEVVEGSPDRQWDVDDCFTFMLPE